MKRNERVLGVVSVVVLAGIVLLGMSGCYREVIRAEGIGADQSYPRRAKSSEPAVDRAIDELFEEKNH